MRDLAAKPTEVVLGLGHEPGAIAWALVEHPGQLVRRGVVHVAGSDSMALLSRDLVDVWAHYGPFVLALPTELELPAAVVDGLSVVAIEESMVTAVPMSALALEPSPCPSLENAALVAMAALITETATGNDTMNTTVAAEASIEGIELVGMASPNTVARTRKDIGVTATVSTHTAGMGRGQDSRSPHSESRSARRWLTVGDLMVEYGLSRAAVYRLPVRHFTPVGRRRRYLRQDVEAHFRASVHPVPALVAVTSRAPARDDEDLQAKWDKLADELGL